MTTDPRSALVRLWAAAVDLVLPETCAGCGSPGHALCPACGRPLLAAPRLAWPTPAPEGLPPPFAVTEYEGSPRAAILAYKEHRQLGLAGPLGQALAAAVARAWESVRHLELDDAGGPEPREPGARRGSANPDSVLLVPIPSGRAAVRARGRDPMAGLARTAARQLRRAGVPAVRLAVLAQARMVRDQAGLSAEARAGNLAGALVVRKARARLVCDRRVVLVDDIITTGTTLAEAARSLRAVGAEPVAAAVIAATQRHIPR